MATHSRRRFLKYSVIGGSGLILGIVGTNIGFRLQKILPASLGVELNPFVMIDGNGVVMLVNSRIDMGQGAVQAVTSMIAEDLEVRLDQVRIIPSDGTARYGYQMTGNSSTVRGLWTQFRQAGAAAREMLVQAASLRWKVPVSRCEALEGAVYLRGTGKSLTYGELAEEAARLKVPEKPKLKDPRDFKILGKSNPRRDIPSKVNGSAVYAIDITLPGMLYAVTVHPPSIHGKLVRFDASGAMAIPGVRHVIKTERFVPTGKRGDSGSEFSYWSLLEARDAIAVVADNYWSALKASRELAIEWDDEPYKAVLNTQAYVNNLHGSAAGPGNMAEDVGDFDGQFRKATKTVEALYETPFLAHAAIEPVNATVDVRRDGTVEIWASIQGADWALDQAAIYLGISKDKIKIHPVLLGGSFGRKGYMDFLKEALDISRQLGVPIKLIWSREQEMTQGPYRPAMLSKMRGVVAKGHELTALSHHAIGESIQGQHWDGNPANEADSWIVGELSKANHRYAFDVHQLSYSRVKTLIPTLWWRSVYASNFAWGQECFIDEMAHMANTDPLKARRILLRNSERDLKIIDKMEDLLRQYAQPKDHAVGIAMFRSFGSMCAVLVEVSGKGGKFRIVKVTSIIDCGLCVNPDNVRAQTEGNIVMGLSAALKGGITFSEGKCDQSNYHEFEIMRMREMPVVEVHVMSNLESPGGVGEPGLPPVAPALGNAIYNLTGKRIRKLPLNVEEIFQGVPIFGTVAE